MAVQKLEEFELTRHAFDMNSLGMWSRMGRSPYMQPATCALWMMPKRRSAINTCRSCQYAHRSGHSMANNPPALEIAAAKGMSAFQRERKSAQCARSRSVMPKTHRKILEISNELEQDRQGCMEAEPVR